MVETWWHNSEAHDEMVDGEKTGVDDYADTSKISLETVVIYRK